MEVRNILLGCPNLTIFWLYRDRSNVQSWNMAYSLLWIIILWAVICTEILGRELKYQLTSLLFKNRDKYVPPNCHCLAARSVTHCHMSPFRAQTVSSNTFPLKLCRLFSPCLFFQPCLSIKVSSTSERLGFTLQEARENLAVRCHWSWIGPWHMDRGCMWLLQHSFDKHSAGWSGAVNVHIKLNSQIEC